MLTDPLRVEMNPGYDAALHADLQKEIGEPIDVVQRKGMTGETATWIVIATLVMQALPHVLNFLKDLIQSKKVKSIEYGGTRIENPTLEMAHVVMEKIRADLGRR